MRKRIKRLVVVARIGGAKKVERYQEDAAGEGRNEVSNVATFRKPFVAIAIQQVLHSHMHAPHKRHHC